MEQNPSFPVPQTNGILMARRWALNCQRTEGQQAPGTARAFNLACLGTATRLAVGGPSKEFHSQFHLST